MSSRGVRGGRLLAGAVLVVGLVLSAIATRYVQRNVAAAADARFAMAAEATEQEISKRLEAYVATIRSGAALFAASERVTRAEFRHFVDALEVTVNYPGIQGLGFSVWLTGTPEEREATVERLLDGFEPHPPPPGGRQTAIVLLEPQDARNLAALGFDMWADPTRRAAMERARDLARPAASGKVVLVQEITEEKQAGFLIYVPVYRDGDPPRTVEERRKELLGWVYAPFRMHDLIRGIFPGGLAFPLEITAENGEGDRVLFRSGGAAPGPEGRVSVRRLEVAGETWTLVMRGPAGLSESEALLPPAVLVASALVTLLLFGITWSLVQGREAAEQASSRLAQSEAERTRLLEAERAARREAERARERAAFLADVSTELATSLSAPDMLERIARRILPFAGDGCAIDLFDESHELRRAVAVYKDAPTERLIRELYKDVALTRAFAPTIRRVAETGEPALLPDVPERFLDERLPEHLRPLGKKLIRSLVIVPLPGREGFLGTISFSSERPNQFGPAELELALDLGRRVGMALDNIRLFANAQEAVRVRDDFLSIASHELRTPLTALQAHLQGLLRNLRRGTPVNPAQIAVKLETALRQTRRLGRLVNDLLDVSRITSGRLQLERETFDLAELALEFADRFREEAERAGTELRVYAPPGAVGRWDRHRMEQVLTNLLSNALKYGAGKPVDLEVLDAGANVVLRVRDRGVGIPEEAQARIFGRFERAASERHYGGLGLGLYITREIVVAHGGEITVRSAPGEGATFLVTLPRNL